MNIDIENIKNKLKTFLDTYLPDAYSACLTGSFVDPTFNDESDLDLWVISYRRDYTLLETFIYNEQKIQVTQIPFTKVDEILWLDYFTKNGIYLGAFAKAQIIKDTNNYLLNLIKQCRTIYQEGPQKMTVLDLQIKKSLVLNCLSDFKGTQSKQESFVILNDLFSHFTSFFIHYNGGWTNGGGKHQIRNLKKFAPQLYEQLFTLYEHYFLNLDKKPLTEFFNNCLKSFENLDEGYSLSESLIEVKQSYLVIQVFGLSDYYAFAQNKLPLIIDLVQGNIDDYTAFRTRAIGDSKINEESLYIILFAASATTLNQNIIPQLNEFILQDKSFSANFPVNLDLSLIFTSQDMVRPVISWLSEFMKQFQTERLTETKSLIAAIEIFRLLYLTLFDPHQKVFLNFLNYLNALWSTASYDRGRFYRIDQLLIEKMNLEETFKRQYEQQKRTLESIFFTDEFKFFTPQCVEGFKSLFNRLHGIQLNPININPIIANGKDYIIPEKNWIIYQIFLKNILAGLFIPDNKMYYISYSVMAIVKDKNQTPHENLAVPH